VGNQQERSRRSLEERAGPIGLFIGAIVAACLTWLASLWLFR
jgi:hypothetical protein